MPSIAARPLDRPRSWVFSTAALLVANSIPLFGVLFFHWQVFPLLLLYWVENVFVGLFNVFRLLLAETSRPEAWLKKLGLIPFFCIHYGMFTYGHGALLLALFRDRLLTSPEQVASAVASCFSSS